MSDIVLDIPADSTQLVIRVEHHNNVLIDVAALTNVDKIILLVTGYAMMWWLLFAFSAVSKISAI
jgi:hypothetical protein